MGEESGELRAFPMTQWSLIGRAAHTDAPGMREALESLLKKYLPALRARLIIDRRMNPDRAADLLQGFISDKVLEQRLLRRADREAGRFRTFILTALDHYVIDVYRFESAKIRSPGKSAADIDAVAEPAASDVVGNGFDIAWARQVIAEAVNRMQKECEVSGRLDLWGIFQARVLGPAVENAEPLAYDELVEKYHLKTPEQASNVLMTAKRMFARALRGVVAEYAESEEDVEGEIADLRSILAAAGAGNGQRRRN